MGATALPLTNGGMCAVDSHTAMIDPQRPMPHNPSNYSQADLDRIAALADIDILRGPSLRQATFQFSLLVG